MISMHFSAPNSLPFYGMVEYSQLHNPFLSSTQISLGAPLILYNNHGSHLNKSNHLFDHTLLISINALTNQINLKIILRQK